MKFSVLANSRERPTLLLSSLQSFQDTTDDLSNLEYKIRIDNDDWQTLDFLEEILSFSFASTIIDNRDQEMNLNRNLNLLFKVCTGDVAIAFNDDCQLATKGWDTLVSKAIDEYLVDKPDGICYIKTFDNSQDKAGDYAAFPMITRKAVEALGYFMSEEFPVWGCDPFMYRVYSAVDRVLPLPIQINHVLHVNGLDGDHMKAGMLAKYAGHRKDFMTCPIDSEVAKLRQSITPGAKRRVPL